MIDPSRWQSPQNFLRRIMDFMAIHMAAESGWGWLFPLGGKLTLSRSHQSIHGSTRSRSKEYAIHMRTMSAVWLGLFLMSSSVCGQSADETTAIFERIDGMEWEQQPYPLAKIGTHLFISQLERDGYRSLQVLKIESPPAKAEKHWLGDTFTVPELVTAGEACALISGVIRTNNTPALALARNDGAFLQLVESESGAQLHFAGPLVAVVLKDHVYFSASDGGSIDLYVVQILPTNASSQHIRAQRVHTHDLKPLTNVLALASIGTGAWAAATGSSGSGSVIYALDGTNATTRRLLEEFDQIYKMVPAGEKVLIHATSGLTNKLLTIPLFNSSVDDLQTIEGDFVGVGDLVYIQRADPAAEYVYFEAMVDGDESFSIWYANLSLANLVASKLELNKVNYSSSLGLVKVSDQVVFSVTFETNASLHALYSVFIPQQPQPIITLQEEAVSRNNSLVAGDALYFQYRDPNPNSQKSMLWRLQGNKAKLLRGTNEQPITPEHLLAHNATIYFQAEENGKKGIWRVSTATSIPMGYLMRWTNFLDAIVTRYPSGDLASGVASVAIGTNNYLLFTEPDYTVWIGDGTSSNLYYATSRGEGEVLIYPTEGQSRAPSIELSRLPYQVVFFTNRYVTTRDPTTVTTNQSGTTTVISVSSSLNNGDIWFGDDQKIHASRGEGKHAIVMAYVGIDATHSERGLQILTSQVVRLKAYTPDLELEVNLGAPIESPTVNFAKSGSNAETNITAFVARGRQERRSDNGYIYQHKDAGPMNGRIWAVRTNATPENMEVFWMKPSVFGVNWPIEMHRYTASWPEGEIYLRRTNSLEPRVEIHEDLNPFKMPEELFSDPAHHGYLNGREFFTDGPGKSLLLFESGPADRRDWVHFEVIRSVWQTSNVVLSITNRLGQSGVLTNFASATWTNGCEITNAHHAGPYAGFINRRLDIVHSDRYHSDFYGEVNAFGMATGAIFAVNLGSLEVWWSHLILTNRSEHHVNTPGIQLPSYAVVYSNVWPSTQSCDRTLNIDDPTNRIPLTSIARPDGWSLYYQNNTNLPGFNPNDEHVVIVPVPGGSGQTDVYPLRNDLTNATDGSEAYVLLQHPGQGGMRPDLSVHRVELDLTKLRYTNCIAGERMPLPFPLPELAKCRETTHAEGWGFKDRVGDVWAMAGPATNDGKSKVVMEYYYPQQDGFYWPPGVTNEVTTNRAVAWLAQWRPNQSGALARPYQVTCEVVWPTNYPVIYIGQTLTKTIDGLPEIWGQTAAEILYQQSANNTNLGGEPSVALIDPLWPHGVTLDKLPPTLPTLPKSGKLTFPKLPAHLRDRLIYHRGATSNQLQFVGQFIQPAAGIPYLLPNVMTERENNLIQSLDGADEAFKSAVDRLYEEAKSPRYVTNANVPKERLALVAGLSKGYGFVTLAFNNSTNFNGEADPIDLKVIFVTNSLYRGELKVVESDNVLDESLTLRHSSDFAGQSGRYIFEWRMGQPDAFGQPPTVGETTPPVFESSPPGGTGAVDVTISSKTHAPRVTLRDNYLYVRYRSLDPTGPAGSSWSGWTDAGLAEGWIKRVMKGLTPFEQRFKAFANDTRLNTLVSMISQAGPAYEGPVALNAESINQAGLIEAYQTVFERGRGMAYKSSGEKDDGADQALTLAASRMADMYMLLGNEAYADALNPTIGFGADGGEYGASASSVHAFMNQTASLMDEELALLRGRGNTNQPPGVGKQPFYNRLVWNMSSDTAGGEAAYVLNYEISDVTGKDGDPTPDGFISEDDAKVLYPQGHGDAWGHYLSAMADYYKLLQEPKFSWKPRAESINIGGQPVFVDYFDERKFVAAAAAKARTGREITELTYRRDYQPESFERWTGYPDQETNCAWGVVDWARRSSQAAYFDWLVGNSLVPQKASGATETNTVYLNPIVTYTITNNPPVTNIVYSFGCVTNIYVLRATNSWPVLPPVLASSIFHCVSNTLSGTNWSSVCSATVTVCTTTNVYTNELKAVGLLKIDRDSVWELRELAAEARGIQEIMNNADAGLSPLGLAESAILFDLDPAQFDQGQSHFEQMYARAIRSLESASEVFGRAQASSQRLRKQFDSVQDMQRNVREREVDFNNRLIEVFGTPYPDDIGPTGAYPTGYEGPDYLHFDCVEPTMASLYTQSTTIVAVPFWNLKPKDDGTVEKIRTNVFFSISKDAQGIAKPMGWNTKRRSVGEIQNARSEMVQAVARFERTRREYDNLIEQLDNQVDLLAKQKKVNREELLLLNRAKREQISLNAAITRARAKQQDFRRVGNIAVLVGNTLADTSPSGIGATFGMANGFWTDPFGAIRGAARQIGTAVNEVMSAKSDSEAMIELDLQQSKEVVSADSNIDITDIKGKFGLIQQEHQILHLLRQEALTRLDLYTQQETLQQLAGRYSTVLAKGERLLAEQMRFKKQTAEKLQDFRYKDMAFRIFRDDALQKYRAHFDAAARMVYLTAKAYDYETAFKKGDRRGAGADLLGSIVRAQALGEFTNGKPGTSRFDGGLAEPMARMGQNWSVLEGQLGFNNPQTESGRFSLRSELFRIPAGTHGDEQWREKLKSLWVHNILSVPEFRQYCLPFQPTRAAEPGLVIEFPSTITFGHNFFGWLAGGGDNSYDSANFATKIRSVGIWFANYNAVVGNGMVNSPRVYLIPVGTDILRSPSENGGDIREFNVLDQVLPVPFPLGGASLADPHWLPAMDASYASSAAIRRHGSIRAYHDSGVFNEAELTRNSRLVGRSVWNTRWLLIIPAGTLHSDREEGLARFIDGESLPNGTRDGNGVKDIKLFFQTYSFEGQ